MNERARRYKSLNIILYFPKRDDGTRDRRALKSLGTHAIVLKNRVNESSAFSRSPRRVTIILFLSETIGATNIIS